jgi:flagellin-like protein
MNLKQLLNDDDAVSPVIGVILMVAITVILAAVIATFVLGLGEQISETSPNTSFAFDYNDGDDTLDVTHSGGPNIDKPRLSISGIDSNNNTEDWSNPVKAGDTNRTNVDTGETISVVWENEQETESSTLQRFEIPDS